MAGSRLPNFGTIFSRTTGLLKSGALKETPLWYDVYKKHPPEIEPNSDRPEPPQEPIPELVYEEDFERAKLSSNKYKTRANKSQSSKHSANLLKDII